MRLCCLKIAHVNSLHDPLRFSAIRRAWYHTNTRVLTMTSSSSCVTMFLLAVCLGFACCVGSACAAPTSMPAACLRAATSLCQGSHTSALRCLMDKARTGDAAVPQACSKALQQQLFARPQQLQQGDRRTRAKDLSRLLNEGGACSTTAIPACPTVCNSSGPNQCTNTCYCHGYVPSWWSTSAQPVTCCTCCCCCSQTHHIL